MKNQPHPLAILSGRRTPFCRAGGELATAHPVGLGVSAVHAALEQARLSPDQIDEVVMGNVSGPADSANIARVISLQSGIPQDRVAHTVNRNCASGMESILTGWQILNERRAATVIAGGTESMSKIPLLFRQSAADLLTNLQREKSLFGRLKVLSRLRPRHFRPVPGVVLGLTDPTCGLNMGQTAENLAREFAISRADQDAFALASHVAAVDARERCFLSGEVAAFDVGQAGDVALVEKDRVPRAGQTIDALQKLRPIFAADGSVTAGNSCPLTDGAAAVVMKRAADVDITSQAPLGYVTSYAIAGCDPTRMGLGPVYAIAKLLQETGLSLQHFDLFEINEAFAAQVLACLAALESDRFAQQELNRTQAVGAIARDRLNVNGGAIALGHPVGTTGTRMIITLLRALRERGLQRGLATLCVGGGQGVAMVVETAI